MSRTDPMLRVRVPPDMKGWLEREAAQNLRSMNAEIVMSIRQRMERERLKKKAAPEGVGAPAEA